MSDLRNLDELAPRMKTAAATISANHLHNEVDCDVTVQTVHGLTIVTLTPATDYPITLNLSWIQAHALAQLLIDSGTMARQAPWYK